jgi:uncharacterized protein
MIRVVVDTNVIVSAMIAPRGNEALLLLAVHQGLVEPCFTNEILEEYAAVLLRPKFRFAQADIDALLGLIRSRGKHLASVPEVELCSDPDDDKFIACALAAGTEFLVTGNKRHFPRSPVRGVKILNAAELLGFLPLEF